MDIYEGALDYKDVVIIGLQIFTNEIYLVKLNLTVAIKIKYNNNKMNKAI